MSNPNNDPLNDALQRQRALSQWDSDGGAGLDRPLAEAGETNKAPPFPRMGDAEFQALHVRVIALENLVIALLADASDQGREQARGMASTISPRPGFTRHPLTTHAAAHIVNLIERATRFCSRGALSR
jgi:hypothetical protein